MNDRRDYEHLERDLDGLNYWFMNSDVEWWLHSSIKEEEAFKDLAKWHKEKQEKLSGCSLFRKGTALYFTYKDKKYYISWTFYSDDYIVGLQRRLKAIKGVSNMQINFGELD